MFLLLEGALVWWVVTTAWRLRRTVAASRPWRWLGWSWWGETLQWTVVVVVVLALLVTWFSLMLWLEDWTGIAEETHLNVLFVLAASYGVGRFQGHALGYERGWRASVEDWKRNPATWEEIARTRP